MIFVIVSDTHGRRFDLGQGHVLVHCGDFTSRGTREEIESFNNWLGEVRGDFDHIIVVPGNHDRLFQENYHEARALLPHADAVLVGTGAVLKDPVTGEPKRLWGSPWTPEFCRWAFGYSKSEAAGCWAHMPSDLNLLITHGPPKGVLDWCPGGNVGCPELLRAVQRCAPKVHCFGHIHEGYGSGSLGPTRFINAAMLDGQYRATPAQAPWVVDL